MEFLDRISTSWKAWVILFLLTFAAAAPGVFSLPALDRDESRFAQASKQMLETGDYIRIRYQDELRNKKPAGIHWLQAGASALLGEGERTAIWTYRVPSWIAAALATLAAFWCGATLIGRRAAFMGAAVFGSTLLLTSEAHISKTDSVLVFLTTLGVGALARLYIRQDNDKKTALLFWAAAGLGFLIKGPVTLMVAAFTMAVLYVWDGRNWSWMKALFWWPGPALFVLLVLPWFIWIQVATDGAFLEGAVGKDLRDKLVSASEGHSGPAGYHLLHIPAWFFPGSLLFVPMITLTWKELRSGMFSLRQSIAALDEVASGPRVHDGRDDVIQGLKFLVAWAAPTWIFFELLPTKLSHYILPAYPAFGLLCGYAALQMMSGARAPVSRWASLFLFALAGGALLAVSYPAAAEALMAETAADFHTVDTETVMTAWAGSLGYGLLLWFLGLVLTLGACIAFAMRRIGPAALLGVFAGIVIGWHARAVFIPAQIWMQPTVTAQMALAEICGLPGRDCADGVSGPDVVQAVGYAEPSFIMTVGTQNLHPPETVVALPVEVSEYPAVFLINIEEQAGTEALAALTVAANEQGRCLMQSAPRYALNYSNGDPVAFVALRIDQTCS